MPNFKISLITVAFNAENTIHRCIRSVVAQKFKDFEYIIIDGGSTDKTVEIIRQYGEHVTTFVSEPDKGIYDAMNKGIKLANGDIIGTINADDFFADANVLGAIADAFDNQRTQIVYSDLDYVDADDRIIRKWRSGPYKPGLFTYGWMPPHPTFYCKRQLFHQYGYYSLDYGTAADYELMLRFMHLHKINGYYLKKVIIKMKIGGISNKSFGNRVKGLCNDWKAMRTNGIPLPLMTLIFKPLRKIVQYF